MFTLLRRQDRNTTGITWLWQHAAMGARSGDLDLARAVVEPLNKLIDVFRDQNWPIVFSTEISSV